MKCYIKNNSGVYIRLQNGKPVTTGENMADIFPEVKAKNIVKSLPRIYKKFNFYVEEIKETENEENIPEYLLTWKNKTEQLDNAISSISNEINSQSDKLSKELSNMDLQIQDILHSIELSDKCDMFSAWKMVSKIRELRRERRKIKNEREILILIKEKTVHSENIQESVINRIHTINNRKYTYKTGVTDEIK